MRNLKLYSTTATILVLATIAAAGTAHAQSETQAPDDGATPLQSDDIIVTAQRRSENLRDVPLSIAAVTADQIRNAGITDTLALTRLAPGLKMDRVGTNLLPAIRGVTTQVTAPGSDPNVALYVDGVYQPSVVTNTFDLPDVERVDVLKGPQGTLFGRNATGGAIQVFTREPEQQLSGTFVASYGNLDEIGASGFLTGPIAGDTVTASLAAGYRRNDGFIHDLRTDKTIGGLEATLVRGKLRIEPSSALTVQLGAFYVWRKDSSNSYGNLLNGNTTARFDPQAIIPIRPYDAATNTPLSATTESWGVNGKITLDAGPGTLTSITAYNDFKNLGLTDGDYAYQPNAGNVFYEQHQHETYFTHEMNYASSMDGPLNFVAGMFYTKGRGSTEPLNLTTPTVRTAIYGTQHIEAAAGFGELYYDITDRLHVIAGLRYSWERRWLESGATGQGMPKPTLNRIGSKSWDSATPRLSIRYEVADDANIYATYSEGFKSGVYNTNSLRLNADGSEPRADPEKIRAYEAGFKGRLAPGVSLNLAGFYYDYKDIQVNAFRDVEGAPLAVLQNAASGRIYGADMDLSLRVSRAFDFQLGAAFLDAKYKDFANASVALPRTGVVGGETVVLNNGNVSTPFDASGKTMIRAPKVTMTATANVQQDVGGGTLRGSLTGYYSSRVFYTFDNRISQKPFATLDARVSWSPEGSGLTFAAYGRNLTDTRYVQGTFITELGDAVSYSPPRTYGVEARFEF